MVYKLCVVLLLVAGQVMAINGFNLLEAGCSVAISAFQSGPCVDEFQRGIKQYEDAHSHSVPKFAMCCQINILESCITEKVEATCGSASGDTVRTIIRGVLETANFLSNGELDCVGHVYYHPASPLCWPTFALAGAGLLLAILLLSCCCVCCCRCCRGRKTGRPGPTIVQMIPASIPHYQPAPVGQVPYRNLNKTIV